MKINELEDRLRGHAKTTKSIISAPFDLKMEVNKLEGKDMNKSKKLSWIKRASAIAAVVALCAITVVAANPVKGFFKDITRWDGAIIGTEYVNATNDLNVDVSETKIENGNVVLTLNVKFENKEEAPFKYIQELSIADYKVTNANGEVIFNVGEDIEDSEKEALNEGEVSLELTIPENILNENEKYFVAIDNMYGLAKAEQPLKLSGAWKCEFRLGDVH